MSFMIMENIVEAKIIEQNTPKGKLLTLFEKEDLTLQVVENQEAQPLSIENQLHRNIIHFYFCLDGSAIYDFGPHYSREIQKQKNYFMYNPEKDLPFVLRLLPQTRMVFLNISLKSLHELFIHDALPFLKPENVNRKF